MYAMKNTLRKLSWDQDLNPRHLSGCQLKNANIGLADLKT